MKNKSSEKKIRVVLVMAATADGRIARNRDELIDWTGKADKKYFVEQTRKAGVMIMGSTTFDTIGKALPGRKSIVMTRNKARKSDDPNLIFTDDAPEKILEDLVRDGFSDVALIGGATINGLFMEKGLIDEVHLTIVPRFFGEGLSLFGRKVDAQLSVKEMKPLDAESFVVVYEVLSS